MYIPRVWTVVTAFWSLILLFMFSTADPSSMAARMWQIGKLRLAGWVLNAFQWVMIELSQSFTVVQGTCKSLRGWGWIASRWVIIMLSQALPFVQDICNCLSDWGRIGLRWTVLICCRYIRKSMRGVLQTLKLDNMAWISIDAVNVKLGRISKCVETMSVRTLLVNVSAGAMVCAIWATMIYLMASSWMAWYMSPLMPRQRVLMCLAFVALADIACRCFGHGHLLEELKAVTEWVLDTDNEKSLSRSGDALMRPDHTPV